MMDDQLKQCWGCNVDIWVSKDADEIYCNKCSKEREEAQ